MQPLAVLSEPIEAGVTVGANWIAEDPLPAWPGVQRWEGASIAEGTPVEMILRLTPDADPIQQRAFLEAHRKLAQQSAGMPLLYTGSDSTIIRTFARTSLAELDRRITSAEAVALAGWYGPAILAMEGGAGGVFTSDTFVVDDDDLFRLAPLGCPGRDLPTLPAELIPPELRGGGEPTKTSGLYGLGVALYRSLTGSDPIEGVDAHGKPLPPPPPSQTVTGLDHRADRVIMALLDADPERRSRALPPPPLRPPRYESVLEESVARQAEAGGARAASRLADAPYVIVIIPRRLRPAIVRKAAAWMGVDEDIANAMALAGLPLPVHGARTQNEARKKLTEYRDLRLSTRAVSMKPTLPIYTLVWVGLLLGTGGAAALTGLPNFIALLAVVMAALAVPAAVGHDIWYSQRVRQAIEMIDDAYEPARTDGVADPETERLMTRIRAMLEHMRSLQITDHAESDLISVLDLTLEGLEDLAEAERLLPGAGERRDEADALRPDLKKSMEGIEAQLHGKAHNPEATHEVELETLLTRAMSSRRAARLLLEAARK